MSNIWIKSWAKRETSPNRNISSMCLVLVYYQALNHHVFSSMIQMWIFSYCTYQWFYAMKTGRVLISDEDIGASRKKESGCLCTGGQITHCLLLIIQIQTSLWRTRQWRLSLEQEIQINESGKAVGADPSLAMPSHHSPGVGEADALIRRAMRRREWRRGTEAAICYAYPEST